MDDPDLKLLLWITVIAALAAAGWYYRDTLLPPEPVPVVGLPEPVIPVTPEDTGPRHPIEESDPPLSTDRTTVPLPPLDDSDAYFLLEVGSVFGEGIESLFLRDAIIDRLVATVDNMHQGHIPGKIRPVRSLQDSFSAATTADDDVYVLSAENFARYDELVRSVTAADVDAAADIYRRFYPLFQKSYERLGYPDAYFNDRVVEVIDLLLMTPEPAEPILLSRRSVLYEFADPTLEALSSGQKLLLRMGAENRAAVKQSLTSLRAKIAADNPPDS